MTMEIVPMEERHLDSLARLEALCFPQPWSREALAGELPNPNVCFLVCMEGGQALGYGGMHYALDEFYVDNIAVYPQHRGRGAGKAILAALVEAARARGGRFISLEVRPSNRPAVGLYKGAGFLEAGRRKNFYTQPLEDGLILTKSFLGEG